MTEEIMRQDIRKVQLNLLTRLDSVCESHGLRYYLAYGTCIGALRHKGFIPWDDDVDVLMPYEDTRKLLRLQQEFGERYFIQSKDTDSDYRSISMRLRDLQTTCIERDEVGLKTAKGIYIDIYPFYECSENRIIRLTDILRSHLLKVLVNNRPPVNHGKLLSIMSAVLLRLYSENGRKRKIDLLEKRLSSVRGSEILDYYGEDITLFTAISYPKEWFAAPKKLEFEGMVFNGPSDPDRYLTKRYGDYMKLPPEKDRVVHHTYVVIDPYKSYREYEKGE